MIGWISRNLPSDYGGFPALKSNVIEVNNDQIKSLGYTY